jgi:hypothetical protein
MWLHACQHKALLMLSGDVLMMLLMASTLLDMLLLHNRRRGALRYTLHAPPSSHKTPC